MRWFEKACAGLVVGAVLGILLGYVTGNFDSYQKVFLAGSQSSYSAAWIAFFLIFVVSVFAGVPLVIDTVDRKVERNRYDGEEPPAELQRSGRGRIGAYLGFGMLAELILVLVILNEVSFLSAIYTGLAAAPIWTIACISAEVARKNKSNYAFLAAMFIVAVAGGAAATLLTAEYRGQKNCSWAQSVLLDAKVSNVADKPTAAVKLQDEERARWLAEHLYFETDKSDKRELVAPSYTIVRRYESDAYCELSFPVKNFPLHLSFYQHDEVVRLPAIAEAQ